MLFNPSTFLRIGKRLARLSTGPLYVQFYITARCNLTCKQCNIIYANAAVAEATLEQIDRIAHNLRRIGTAVVLLTGGEPFMRKDLPEIVRAFAVRGIHVRIQTNGIATVDQLEAARSAGTRDISISLDSLRPAKQDFINGSYRESWERAINAISAVTTVFPPADSFAVFGTVLSPLNILEIPNIIRFATAAGWYVSLVPAHITEPHQTLNFRSYDREMRFPESLFPVVDRVLDECLELKRKGGSLYDSAEYIDNIRLFIKERRVRWRRRNANRCDSPELYFAIRPNGDLQVCCDHVLRNSYPVWHEQFPQWYKDKTFFNEVYWHTGRCPGCMYGSFPEVSITAHYPLTALERSRVFWKTGIKKRWPLTKEKILDIIAGIEHEFPVDDSLARSILESLPSHAAATVPMPRAREL